MSLTERSERRVDAALARLFEQFGGVDLVETEWGISVREYDRTVRRFEAGSVGGAGAWVVRDNPDGPEALLVRHVGEDGWSEPSGKHQPRESLATTARRETREETGVRCEPVEVLRAERAIHVAGDRPPLHRLVVVFGATYLGGVAAPREGEIAEVGWFTSHPADLRYPGVAGLPIE